MTHEEQQKSHAISQPIFWFLQIATQKTALVLGVSNQQELPYKQAEDNWKLPAF